MTYDLVPVETVNVYITHEDDPVRHYIGDVYSTNRGSYLARIAFGEGLLEGDDVTTDRETMIRDLIEYHAGSGCTICKR